MTLLQGAECGKIIEARSITAAEIDQTSASQLLSSVPKSNEMVLICQQNDETTCASTLNRDDLLSKFLLVLKLASLIMNVKPDNDGMPHTTMALWQTLSALLAVKQGSAASQAKPMAVKSPVISQQNMSVLLLRLQVLQQLLQHPDGQLPSRACYVVLEGIMLSVSSSLIPALSSEFLTIRGSLLACHTSALVLCPHCMASKGS